jgi:glutamate dehydrogenase
MGPQVPELLPGRRAQEAQPPGGGVRESRGARGRWRRHTASLLDWYSLLDIVEIATDTGRDPQDVAALYYVVSERFGIDAMLGKVTRLPRDDRWDALARGALRDDLYSVLESLTRGVLDANPADGAASDPGEQYDVWARANQDSISRTKGALSGIVRLDNPNIAALSVALRTLRSVVRVGAATT